MVNFKFSFFFLTILTFLTFFLAGAAAATFGAILEFWIQSD